MISTLAPAAPPVVLETALALPASPLRLERRHWLAALAILFVFFAPYQTLVQTVLTDDAVRKGLNIDDYDMTWQQVGYLVGLMYGLFTGRWLSARIGARYTLVLGLLGFALGNLLCGAATGLESFVLGRFVDGFGKTMVMANGRTTLYKQFDRRLLVAIGFYGIFAYATRNATPLLMAELDVPLLLAVDVLVLHPGRASGDGARMALLPSRSPAQAHAPAHRLAGSHTLHGLGGGRHVRLQLVSQVGRLDVERVCRDGPPLRDLARGPRGLARVELQPRRTPEAAAADPRLHPGLRNPGADAHAHGRAC